MKVLLVADIGIGEHGFYHVGDEAMWYATYLWYRKHHPTWQLKAVSRSISHKHLEVEEREHLVLSRTDWNARKYFFWLLWRVFLKKSFGVRWLSEVEESWLSFVTTSDVIHFTGGGNFYSMFVPMLYYFLLIIIVGRLYGKKVILHSQTFGPFTFMDRCASWLVLLLTDEIGIREPKHLAWKWIQPFIRPRLVSMKDAAYDLPLQRNEQFTLPPSKKLRIGLSLHAWKGFDTALRKNVMNFLKSISVPYEMVLIPHILMNNSSGDMSFMKEMMKELSRDIQITTFTYEDFMNQNSEPACVVKYLTSQMNFILTTRYHGVIFGLSTHVPTVTIITDDYYRAKNENAMRLDFHENFMKYCVGVHNKDFVEKCTDILNMNKKADVIIVLAGGIKDDGSLPENVQHRIQKAKEMFDAKRATRVLMSGRWSAYRNTHLPPWTEAEAMQRYAVKIGIPKKAILKEEKSHDTESNVHNIVYSFLKPHTWKNVIIISSDFHIPRVKRIFSKHIEEGYDVTYVGSHTTRHRVKWVKWAVTEFVHKILHSRRLA